MGEVLYSNNKASEVMTLLPSPSHSKHNVTTPQPKPLHYTANQRYHCVSPDIIQPPRPFTSRYMEYFRNYAIEVVRSSLGHSSEGGRQIFPSLRQIYRWILLLILLLVDVKEEEEPPEPPQCFSRPGDTLLVHEPLQPQEKPFSVNKHHKVQIVLPTPKAKVDNFCIDVKNDSHTHQSTYDELIVETDSLVIQLKADNQSDNQVEPLDFLPGSAKFNSCFLRQENGHKNTRSFAQIPRCLCLSPKDKAKSFENHLASSQVLPAFHNNADPRRHKPENRSNADNCSHRWNHNRLLHSSSSSDLRRQRSHVQMDPDAIRYVCPQKQDSSTTSCSSNSSSSGKRPCVPRGQGVQLIEGKTIGEILHANPLIRKGDTSLALAPWRS